jgi:small subunit ribosomal protein S8
MVDPIADMLTIIRNGYAARKETVVVPYSKLKLNIAKLLQKEKYIKAVEKFGRKTKKILELQLLYKEGKTPAISGIRKISKPSRRVYFSLKDIKPVRQGKGIMILTTPKGVLTGEEARKEKVGGEVIAELW